MNQQVDERWGQLQSHIEGFFRQFLTEGAGTVEYKPQFAASCGEMPVDQNDDCPRMSL